MSAMMEKPCALRIAAIPAAPKRLSEGSPILLSCSSRAFFRSCSSSELCQARTEPEGAGAFRPRTSPNFDRPLGPGFGRSAFSIFSVASESHRRGGAKFPAVKPPAAKIISAAPVSPYLSDLYSLISFSPSLPIITALCSIIDSDFKDPPDRDARLGSRAISGGQNLYRTL